MKAIFIARVDGCADDYAYTIKNMHPLYRESYKVCNIRSNDIRFDLPSSEHTWNLSPNRIAYKGFTRFKRNSILMSPDRNATCAKTHLIGIQRSYQKENGEWVKSSELRGINPMGLSINFFTVKYKVRLVAKKLGIMNGKIYRYEKWAIESRTLRFATRAYYKRNIGSSFKLKKLSTKHNMLNTSNYNIKYINYLPPVETERDFKPIEFGIDTIKGYSDFSGLHFSYHPEIMGPYLKTLKKHNITDWTEHENIDQFVEELIVTIEREIRTGLECYGDSEFYLDGERYSRSEKNKQLDSLFEGNEQLYYRCLSAQHNRSIQRYFADNGGMFRTG